MANCNPQKIVAALHEQALEITDIVREEIRDSDRFALRLIPDGGTVRRHSNQDTVIYGEAKQAPVAYQSLDHAPRPLRLPGSAGPPNTPGSVDQGVSQNFPGRNLQGANGIFSALANDIDDNACHGMVTIDFSQGYRIRRTSDYGLDLDTPIKCARELDRLGEAHIRGYFNGFKNQFTAFGMDNFSENLLNLAIQYGEANAAVMDANRFNVSTGGWEDEPDYPISICFLQDYRDYIMATMKGFGMRVSEDWQLQVEMPRNDWFDAVTADIINRRGVGNAAGIETSLSTSFLKDEEGPLRGRMYHDYGGIRCYFNETPIRGYFVPTNETTGKRFVRVYDWINVPDEEGGLVRRANHQYRQNNIVVDGVRYPMVTLIPHIDPRSFKRYGLIKPLKPFGTDNAGVNYEVRVIDGPSLGCNDFNDKFKFAARHEFRFKAEYPELSGFIAYRSSRRAGYVISLSTRADDTPDYTKATLVEEQVFRSGSPDDCQTAECAQCGKVPDSDGSCVDVGGESETFLKLVPSGAVTVVNFGANSEIIFTVERTGGSGACSVDYATADVAGNDSGDAITATSGTLEWAAGDMQPKTVSVPFLATADDNDDFYFTLSNAVGATLAAANDRATCKVDQLG